MRELTINYDGVELAKLLPETSAMSRHIAFELADVYARLDDERALRRGIVVGDATAQQQLDAYDALLADLIHARQLDAHNAPLSIQLANAKKLANKLPKIFADKREDKSTFGKQSEALIFIICHIVRREMEELIISDPAAFHRYATGIDRTYWLDTCTQSLCVILNKSKLSLDLINGDAETRRKDKRFQALLSAFRKEEGYFKALLKAGFVLKKVNRNQHGETDKARKVSLQINLDWVFGHRSNVLKNLPIEPQTRTDAAEIPSIGAQLRENSSYLYLENFKETEYKINGGLAGQESSALRAEEIEEKEENINPNLNTKEFEEKNTGPRAFFSEESTENAPKAAVSPNELLWEASKDSANKAMRLIFNAENLQNGKIRHNSAHVVEDISIQTVKDMPHWMMNIYRELSRYTGKSPLEVAAMVNEGIEHTANFAATQPTWYVYHPKFWLDLHFSGGSLYTYVRTYIADRADPLEKTDQQAALAEKYTPQIAWMLQNGADRSELMKFVRKFGEQVVTDCIAFGGAKIADGFKPKGTPVAYIFGILRHVNPAVISATLTELKAKIADKKAKVVTYWTLERIQQTVLLAMKTESWREKFTVARCQQLADHYKFQNISELQMKEIIYQLAYKMANKAQNA